MKKSLFILAWLLAVILQSCSLFTAVDPLPPAFSTLEVVDIKRNEITVTGTISNPDSKNDRQEKKSGTIVEYGLVYGTGPSLDIEKDKAIKLGGAPAQVPVSVQNQKITGLASDTRYYVALYARNEGGGMAYSDVLDVKTTLLPPAVITRNSVKVAKTGSLWYDFDAGNAVTAGDPKTDVTINSYSITGRGTVLEINTSGSVQFINLGVADYDKLTYLDLVRVTGYNNTAISYLFNAQTINTVIAFKTGEGRLGKWRIEGVSSSEITMSLITYEN
ncbi:MAG: fibronectin type III domain-containing protein [Dyadobacter fermentans]